MRKCTLLKWPPTQGIGENRDRITLLITTTIGRRSWIACRIALSVFTCLSPKIVNKNIKQSHLVCTDSATIKSSYSY